MLDWNVCYCCGKDVFKLYDNMFIAHDSLYYTLDSCKGTSGDCYSLALTAQHMFINVKIEYIVIGQLCHFQEIVHRLVRYSKDFLFIVNIRFPNHISKGFESLVVHL